MSSSTKEVCEEIHKSFRGRGVDADRLIKVVAQRFGHTRKGIRETYQKLYGEDLLKLLESKLHGKLEDAMVLWMLDNADRDALIIHKALESWCKDYNALTEIICTRSTPEIAGIAQAYRSRFNKELENDIASETSGLIKKVLLALVYSSRSSAFQVSMELARSDARSLCEARKRGSISDEKVIIRTFSERSKDHLQVTFESYKQMFGQDLKKALKKRTGEAFENELRAVIKCIQSPAHYFAKALHIAMKGLGTDDDVLTRIVVARAEVDMHEIKHIFRKKYKEDLQSCIAGDTVGDFRTFLLALVNL